MSIKYRPEIDGLRAIAVGAVILYHAQITILGHQPFKGGFIGVDIFFVISGYLITSIILKELITTGSFHLKIFYERRIRRILPALLFVMLVSLPFAWMYLLPGSFIDFSKSILYSLGFGSNFYFHYSGQQYGAESGLLKPFLHTWSLSVEEQFYILFPIVLLVTFKYFRKYLIYTLILGFIISLELADWGSRNNPSFNFYVLPTRSWELLAGSILAYFKITLGNRSKNKTLNLILPSIGLFLIGHSILFFNDKMFHPSFYTLSPIIGVCLIIWFSHKDELITKILSTKLFVGIGLISYSLYLWHYPIFAFARIIEFTQESLFNKVILVTIAIILSIFSYFFIERPARNKKNKLSIILSLILILVSVLVILNFSVLLKKGYKNRVHQILYNDVNIEPYHLLRNLNNELCHTNKSGCIFNPLSNKDIFLIGDSLMASINFDLKKRVVQKGYRFTTYTFAGCLYFPNFYKMNKHAKKKDKICDDNYFSKIEKILLDQENSIIILGGRFPLYLTNKNFDNKEGMVEGGNVDSDEIFISTGKYSNISTSFEISVKKLLNKNQVLLIYPIPEVGTHVPKKIFNSLPRNLSNQKTLLKKFLKKDNFITTSYEVYKDRTQSSFELLDSIQGDNIYRVYPHKLFCDTILKYRCVTHDDTNIFYADGIHPSIKSAEMINDLIMKEIEKIELKSN